ncbi:hypothetical protein Hanom_Chr01g00046251 [Helianthus anomalus]
MLIGLGVDYQNHEWHFGGRRWSLVMVVMNPATTKVLKLVAFVSSICVGDNTVLKHGLSILNDPNKCSALGPEGISIYFSCFYQLFVGFVDH